MKADTITLTPNGRLTEHTAHMDVRGNVPPVMYRNASGRAVNFIPMKLIMFFQWSWTTSAWHLLEIKALGKSGVQDVKVTFRDPDVTPEWVQDAVRKATPVLTLPQEMKG